MYVPVGTEVPVVECGPGALEGEHDAGFELGAGLLHYDYGFLEEVFFEDLAGELPRYGGVGDVSARGYEGATGGEMRRGGEDESK